MKAKIKVTSDFNSAVYGPVLGRIRVSLGLTAKQLSEISGISVSTISAFEIGNRNMSVILAAKLLSALDMSEDCFKALSRYHAQKSIDLLTAHKEDPVVQIILLQDVQREKLGLKLV